MQSHGLHFCSNFASKNIIQSQTTYFFLFLSFSFPFSFLIHFLLYFLATTYFSLYLYYILFSILLFSIPLSRFLSPFESNLAHMFLLHALHFIKTTFSKEPFKDISKMKKKTIRKRQQQEEEDNDDVRSFDAKIR